MQYSGEELVDEIRNERRKELCLEGHRWFDLRRYAACVKYPFKKEIVRVFAEYSQDNNYKTNNNQDDKQNNNQENNNKDRLIKQISRRRFRMT